MRKNIANNKKREVQDTITATSFAAPLAMLYNFYEQLIKIFLHNEKQHLTNTEH
ncbi:MAG TPA: hypothetical protein VG603_08050 [Chitinophagales bacterium]|nr:hypothetical protein [Chitinophagales bacterium]